MLTASLGPLAIICPGFEGNLQLRGHLTQHGCKRFLGQCEHHTGIAHVAQLHGEAQAVGRAAPLPDDGQIGVAERVITDQVFLGVRQRQQAFALGGGQDRTAGHAVSFFLET